MKLIYRYAIAIVFLLVSAFIYIIVGRYMNVSIIPNIITGIRIPRLILAFITGAVLASGGAVMQGVLRNPLADPYLLGISGGAVLGSAIAHILVPGNIILSVFMSFAGGFAIFMLTLFISGIWKGNRQYSMIIAGIMTGTFASSAVALLFIFSNRGAAEYFYTVMGTLNIVFISRHSWLYAAAVIMILAAQWILVWKSREMDIISSGYDIAMTSGINVKRTLYLTMILTAFSVSLTVAFTGIIGFVGIMVPHIVKRFMPSKHFHIYIMSMICGSILLIGADFIVKNVFVYEIPVGIITALMGIPFFIYVLKRETS